MISLEASGVYSCISGDTNETMTRMSWSGSGLSFREIAYAYGPQILLLVALLAITIYRKEMSCNRCYAEQEENRTCSTSSSASSSVSESSTAPQQQDASGHVSWDDGEAESLLEEAGCYCSGVYNLLLTFIQMLHKVLPKALANGAWDSLSSWWVVAAEGQRLDEILEGAENWCVRSPPHAPPRGIFVPSSIAESDDTATHQQTHPVLFPSAEGLPTDVTVHILSFLHPKDVMSFACTSNPVRNAVDDDTNEISTALWKTLWYRDYSWIVVSWDVGREAANRSFQSSSARSSDQRISAFSFGDVLFTKEFYFRFGLSYLNYVLAGQCTAERCLVGLGGHIYDLTGFLHQHPGSPETVIVHAGRDASAVFESMRHTVAARKLAQQLCVAVDMTLLGGNGVRPTSKLVAESKTPLPLPLRPEMPNGRPQAKVASTLEAVRDEFRNEQDEIQRRAAQWLARAPDAILGEVHAYYDPFCDKWKAWYINESFEAVFVDNF